MYTSSLPQQEVPRTLDKEYVGTFLIVVTLVKPEPRPREPVEAHESDEVHDTLSHFVSCAVRTLIQDAVKDGSFLFHSVAHILRLRCTNASKSVTGSYKARNSQSRFIQTIQLFCQCKGQTARMGEYVGGNCSWHDLTSNTSMFLGDISWPCRLFRQSIRTCRISATGMSCHRHVTGISGHQHILSPIYPITDVSYHRYILQPEYPVVPCLDCL